MAIRKSPQFVIDNVQAFTAGQSQVIGPLPGDYEIVSCTLHGNTAAIPTVAAGTYDGTTFTSVTSLVNGLNGAGAALGATTTAKAPGTAVTLVANGPIASGQYLQIVSGTNALERYTLTLVSASPAAKFDTETAPA